jgi:hypothetical protein
MHEQPARDEVGIDVAADQRGIRGAAIHIAARDRLTETMVVLGLRIDERLPVVRRRASRFRIEAVRTLAEPPAVIAARDDAVDFLPRGLPNVTDPEIARRAIEAEAPWVAKTERVDLRARIRAGAGRTARVRGERVARRDRVGSACAHVDPQHLAEQPARVLRIVLRIAGRAAVAHADIKHPVRAELEVAAVVIAERLVDRQQYLLARGIERQSAVAAHVACDQCLELRRAARIVEENATVRCEIRVERHAEQTALAAGDDA